MTALPLQALLMDGVLAGEWVLDPGESSIRLKSSADFFDSGNNPDITFTAVGVRPSDQGAVVTGVLTVRGCTRPVPFDTAVSVQGGGEIWLDAEVRINRADFGLTWNLMGMASMNTTLTIHAVFTRRVNP